MDRRLCATVPISQHARATRPVSVAVARESRLENCLEYDANANANVRIIRVDQVIAAIDVVNVDVVGVIPALRPRIVESKPKTTILEARKTADQHGLVDYEGVLPTKIGAEPVVRYAVTAITTTLLPRAVLGMPGACPTLLPNVPLFLT